MKISIHLLAILGVVLGLSGCGTPQSRIRENPAAFDRATPEQQELIKQGKVAIGFDMDLVQLALGAPDRTRERTDAQGKEIIWSYVNYEAQDGAILYRGWYHRGYWGGPHFAYYTDFPNRRERERFRVVFRMTASSRLRKRLDQVRTADPITLGEVRFEGRTARAASTQGSLKLHPVRAPAPVPRVAAL